MALLVPSDEVADRDAHDSDKANLLKSITPAASEAVTQALVARSVGGRAQQQVPCVIRFL